MRMLFWSIFVTGLIATGRSVPLFAPQAPLSANQVNHRPVIGILSQEFYPSILDFLTRPKANQSMIAASYVKVRASCLSLNREWLLDSRGKFLFPGQFIEMGGGRVVPILINQDREYYERMFKWTNGLLFPGGANNIFQSGYADAAKILWQLAMKGEYIKVE